MELSRTARRISKKSTYKCLLQKGETVKTLSLVALILASLTLLPAAGAADLSGVWKGEFDLQGNNAPITLHLTVTGSTVTGSVETQQTAPSELHEGKIDGDTISFWANADYQGQTYKVLYRGKISGNAISFTMGTEDGNWSSTFSATRSADAGAQAAQSLAGKWNGAFDLNGTRVPLTIRLTISASVVTGTVEGLPTSPAPIEEGKLDGDKLSFWVSTDYQGTTYKVLYTGQISGDQIAFNMGTEDQSWGESMTVTKSM